MEEKVRHWLERDRFSDMHCKVKSYPIEYRYYREKSNERQSLTRLSIEYDSDREKKCHHTREYDTKYLWLIYCIDIHEIEPACCDDENE